MQETYILLLVKAYEFFLFRYNFPTWKAYKKMQWTREKREREYCSVQITKCN